MEAAEKLAIRDVAAGTDLREMSRSPDGYYIPLNDYPEYIGVHWHAFIQVYWRAYDVAKLRQLDDEISEAIQQAMRGCIIDVTPQ